MELNSPAVLLPRKLGLETGATNIKICLEPDSSHAIKEFYMSDDIYPNFLKTMVQANHPQELLRFDRYQKSHENPQGPGDARPTARQIILDENMEGQLVGTTILVTGCSSGIGIETARALAVTGANLVLAVRDLDKAKRVLEDFASTRPALDPEQFELLHMDLNSLDSVRRAAAEFLERHSKLHILINNAGKYATTFPKNLDAVESSVTRPWQESEGSPRDRQLTDSNLTLVSTIWDTFCSSSSSSPPCSGPPRHPTTVALSACRH